MPDYRRNRVPGGTYLFTVNLLDRSSRLLTEHIDLLRKAVRDTPPARRSISDAWAVLPEHMQCVWTLPGGDADHSGRWRAVEKAFSKGSSRESDARLSGAPGASVASGSGGSGNTPSAMRRIMRDM